MSTARDDGWSELRAIRRTASESVVLKGRKDGED